MNGMNAVVSDITSSSSSSNGKSSSPSSDTAYPSSGGGVFMTSCVHSCDSSVHSDASRLPFTVPCGQRFVKWAQTDHWHYRRRPKTSPAQQNRLPLSTWDIGCSSERMHCRLWETAVVQGEKVSTKMMTMMTMTKLSTGNELPSAFGLDRDRTSSDVCDEESTWRRTLMPGSRHEGPRGRCATLTTSGNLPLTFLDSYELVRACTSEKVEKLTRNLKLESKKKLIPNFNFRRRKVDK